MQVRIMGVVATVILLVGVTSPVRGVTVIGDEEAERYVGSGAVLLPSSVDHGLRYEAATCVGCRWKVTAPCLRDDEHGDAGCRGTILGCPQGREISRAWLARPGGDFEPVGLFCPTDGEVTSVAEATARVRGTFERRIPALQVECAPLRGVVVGIPLHCRSLQPSADLRWDDEIAGYQVRTSARAAWQWEFRQRRSDGVVTGTWTHHAHEPGARYPGVGVRQGFTTAGIHEVSVRARWRASFTVDGLGPFSVAPDMEQHAVLLVPTGSALGVVTASRGDLSGGRS